MPGVLLPGVMAPVLLSSVRPAVELKLPAVAPVANAAAALPDWVVQKLEAE